MLSYFLVRPNFRITPTGLHMYVQRNNRQGMVLSNYVCSTFYN